MGKREQILVLSLDSLSTRKGRLEREAGDGMEAGKVDGGRVADDSRTSVINGCGTRLKTAIRQRRRDNTCEEGSVTLAIMKVSRIQW